MVKNVLLVAAAVSLLAGGVGLLVLSGCGGMMPACHNSGGGDMHGGHGMAAVPQASSTAAPVNERCPIMGGAVKASLTRVYKGQTVAFCCGGCPAQWDKLSDADKEARLAKVVK